MSLLALIDNNKDEIQLGFRGVLYEPEQATEYHKTLVRRFQERMPIQLVLQGSPLECAKRLMEDQKISGYRILDSRMAYLYMKRGTWQQVIQYLNQQGSSDSRKE